MIVALRTYKHRIAFAIALSALVHALLLWGPHLRIPTPDAELHPLTARLEPLPDRPRTTPAKPASKPKTAQVVAKPADQAALVSASAVAVAETIVPSETPSSVDSDTTHAPEAADAAAQPSVTPSETSSNKPALLPKHAQLIFAVYRGEKGMYVGEVQHRLDITDQRYSIIAATRTAGLARWFKSYSLNQSSIGTVDAEGLRPENFAEEKNDSGMQQGISASFDWGAHVLHFSDGSSTPLGDTAQDALSMLYQLSLTPLNLEFIDLSMSNGRKLENYRLEIAVNETTETALGTLHTIHLRKMRTAGEAGVEIWLAREYRMLPVKMQYIEPDGTIAATISITDIRVSDE